MKLDANVLDAEEDEIKEEIELAEIYQGKVELAIITLHTVMLLNSAEQSSSDGIQSSATNDTAVTIAQEPQRDSENHIATHGNRSAMTSAAAERDSQSAAEFPR